ncbi:PTS sugar transporter subunit IIA [Limosilactobacillus sp.]|uniref:PTS sugar transporter subunit IIA n=1 Tax=Limosilactobacillus sp. TaxID=2773925 RepID=UPI0025BD48C6|nr:PTS sugar transporter subunit IIA [Limosilactobacillus sp.]MCH3922864.1 glycoside-pentoside-hexuronide (GPH):cation symporter [Limosilactobacillus sp.]MCH3927547.1 glycoside-pentoside-hexuronide (GPH):cation symporter [Limosilactobacillus sp.]
MAATSHKLTGKQIASRASFCFGNVGHSAFYGVMSTYFIIFVTGGMFNGLPKSVANRLIGLITGLIVGVRILELLIDPLLGNIVDNTKSRWGKFKPWIMAGNIVSIILLLILFTGIFGLAKVNWVLFAVLFVIIFITFDIFYSLSDVSYWGMVPAISEDSQERGIYTSLGAFAGTIGWNGLTIIVVPTVTYFTFLATGKHNEGPVGWFAFAAIVSAVALLSAIAVCLGTKEKHNIIRKSAQDKTTIGQVFSAIFHNDQILWPSLAYLLYSCAYVITNGVLFYLYKFVIGKPGQFWIVGVIATIIGFCTSPLFPILNKFIPRKWLFIGGQISMGLAYVIFIFFRSNVFMMDLGLVLFNINFAQLVTVLTLTDAIEYGQLHNGQRNEAVVLAVRPMIDKLTGAISNGLVGYIAIAAGMTGSATAADMTAHDIHTFDSMAFYIPLVFAMLSILVFAWKVTLSEKKHAVIVEELKDKLANGNAESTANATVEMPAEKTEDGAKTETIAAPVSGKVMAMKKVIDADGQPFPGTGFAIKPSEGKIYAPFDGQINFTFGTRHAFGITSDQGLGMVIHIGVGTVNMRGEGFNAHYTDGEEVKAGQLLFDFDRDQILNAGYQDVVVTFFTEPKRISAMKGLEPGKQVSHGDSVVDVEFK